MNFKQILEQQNKLNNFLINTLSGFKFIEFVNEGLENLNNILQNPEKYQLGHISGDIDAWVKTDRLVFQFNNGVHFVFSPITANINHALKYVGDKWV